jgi:RNA polymerase sigma factor (sigma-70 family)
MFWPYRWPMHDREIVAAIVAGDPSGLAAAYDRYAAALHTYCRTLLAEPADAADAVQDTFLIAAAKLDGLRDPDRLRPWLYAVARNECHRRLRARARTVDLDEAGEMSDDAAADIGSAAERADLRGLIRAAMSGLNPGEREVIELSLRHDLEGPDLAGALGVPVNQAHALASRARGQLERSLGALLVARSGREDCPELSEMLAGWDGRFTVLLRKRVSRHVEDCAICGKRKRRELSPAMLLSALPVFMLPPGLRDQVLRLVSDTRPEVVRYRDHVARRAEPFGRSGFPVPIAPFARVRPRGRTIAFATVAALLLILVGGVAAAALVHHGGSANAAAQGPASAGPSAGASTSSSPSGPAKSPDVKHKKKAAAAASVAPSSASPASPTPKPKPTTTTTKPRPTKSPTPSPSITPSPTPSPTPPPGTLSEPSPDTIRLPELGSSATFTLTADGGPVSFSITGPTGLSISPASGDLAAGQTVTVTVTAVGNGPPAFVNELAVNPGGESVEVEYPPKG